MMQMKLPFASPAPLKIPGIFSDFDEIVQSGSRYSVIYADPPWAYVKAGRGAAENHYSTMSADAICGLPVCKICTDTAFLFLWATYPTIADALKVVRAWGFEYKTAAFVWVKKNIGDGGNRFGCGNYTRANAEPCLLGVRGLEKIRLRDLIRSRKISQIIEYPLTRHSAKPPIARDLIVKLLGDCGRIELFARDQTPGWDAWGNEVEI